MQSTGRAQSCRPAGAGRRGGQASAGQQPPSRGMLRQVTRGGRAHTHQVAVKSTTIVLPALPASAASHSALECTTMTCRLRGGRGAAGSWRAPARAAGDARCSGEGGGGGAGAEAAGAAASAADIQRLALPPAGRLERGGGPSKRAITPGGAIPPFAQPSRGCRMLGRWGVRQAAQACGQPGFGRGAAQTRAPCRQPLRVLLLEMDRMCALRAAGTSKAVPMSLLCAERPQDLAWEPSAPLSLPAGHSPACTRPGRALAD